MKQTLPGLQAQLPVHDTAQAYLDALFSAGGLVLSQVLELTGLNAHTVQNWVKRGFVSPPVGKKYNREQFCTIVLIGMYHDILLLQDIRALLNWLGGEEAGAAARVYVCLVDALALMPPDALAANTVLNDIFTSVMPANLSECEQRQLNKALHILVLAYLSSRARSSACQMLETLQPAQPLS